MRLLNPAESCWEAGEVYPWCLSTCRSPAWSYPVELEKGGWMGAAGVPLTQVCLLVKKKKNLPRERTRRHGAGQPGCAHITLLTCCQVRLLLPISLLCSLPAQLGAGP